MVNLRSVCLFLVVALCSVSVKASDWTDFQAAQTALEDKLEMLESAIQDVPQFAADFMTFLGYVASEYNSHEVAKPGYTVNSTYRTNLAGWNNTTDTVYEGIQDTINDTGVNAVNTFNISFSHSVIATYVSGNTHLSKTESAQAYGAYVISECSDLHSGSSSTDLTNATASMNEAKTAVTTVTTELLAYQVILAVLFNYALADMEAENTAYEAY